ncbi:hypothetical protein FRC02_009432 [Tulasnella sp. 418]|nr:hypothetical protein FRC02_009432 [Tulasnella sp. 418]
MDAPSAATVPLSSQVGGHAGVLASEDGSLVIKACLPAERDFYQILSSNPTLEGLRPHVPTFYGTLKLEGKVEGTAAEKIGEAKGEDLVGNLSHKFKKPNILDIKLGTVLYDESANEEKRARMIKTAAETTSLETGVRLTGFQVYDAKSDTFVNTPKSYGKSIKPSDLPGGIAKFFPTASEGGVEAKLLVPVVKGVHSEIAQIRDVLKGIELRMVGGSLLIVWEGEAATLREAIDKAGSTNADNNKPEAEDDEDSDTSTAGVGPPLIVKLIDFAHTRLVPGEGPDEGVLLGLETTLKLLEGRIKEVEAQ